MRWPFISRAWHESTLEKLREDNAALRAAIVKAESRGDWWRQRAAQLIDAGLMRSGAMNEPVMLEAPKRDSPAASLVTGMAMTEVPPRRMAS